MSNELNNLKDNLSKLTPLQRKVILDVLGDVDKNGQPWDFLSQPEYNAMIAIITVLEELK